MHVLTQSPLMKALGWALFNSLWQMALLWLVYSLLISLFRDMTARIRHSLALIALFIGSSWSAVTFIASWLSPDYPSMVPWALLLSPGQTNPGWLWQTCRGFMDKSLPFASSGYLLVLCGLAVRFSNQYSQSRKLTRQGLSKLPSELRVFVASTCRRLSIHTPIRVWLSSVVETPLTLGYLKPVILLPMAIISQLTIQQVEAILIHEFAHILRKDYLLQLMVTALEGLFFFNPFARLLIRQIKKERENCCDDLVLQHQYDSHAYVSALLSLAKRGHPGLGVTLAVTGGGDQLLLQRAKRMLGQDKRSSTNRARTRPMTLLLFTLLMSIIVLYGPSLPGKRQQGPLLVRHVMFPAGARTRPVPVVSTAFSDLSTLIVMSGVASEQKPNPKPAAPAAASHARIAHHVQASADDAPESREDDNGMFVNTVAGDDAPMSSTVGTEQSPGPDVAREYSLIGPGSSEAVPPESDQSGSPYVPNSSFSYQLTTGDSSNSPEKLTYLQQSGRKEIQAAIRQLQIQLSVQLKDLAALKPKAEESVRLRRQLRVREVQLQQEYLQKIIDWQKKWEKATHVRTIVYI
jgi:Zn-dependent protease with chaperone function